MKSDTTPPLKPCRISGVIDEATEQEIAYYVSHHSVNKSALLRRGIRLALDELSAKHATTKPRKQ
jgi:hypothetical protein